MPLILVAMTIATKSTTAQSASGTVRLLPAITSVDVESGAFGVFIIAEALNHQGTIFYDDDRDTTPDREVDSNGMAAFEFVVEFDESVVQIDTIDAGPALEASSRSFQCLPARREPGTIRFGCLSSSDSLPGLQGNLTLATLTLTPQGPGSSPLLLTSQLAGPLGDPIQLNVVGGLVRVTGQAVPTATTSSPISTDTPPTDATVTNQPTESTPLGDGTPTRSTPTAERTANAVETRTPTPDTSVPDDGGNENGAVTLWILTGLGGLTAAGLAAGYLRRRMAHRGAS